MLKSANLVLSSTFIVLVPEVNTHGVEEEIDSMSNTTVPVAYTFTLSSLKPNTDSFQIAIREVSNVLVIAIVLSSGVFNLQLTIKPAKCVRIGLLVVLHAEKVCEVYVNEPLEDEVRPVQKYTVTQEI